MKNTFKNVLIIIVSIIALVVGALFATYALITPTKTVENLNVNSQVNGSLSFNTTGGTNLTNTVSYQQMSIASVGSVVMDANDTLDINLKTDGAQGICCNYDINWEWSSSSFAYSLTPNATKEFTIEIDAEGKYLNSSDEEVEFDYATKPYAETQLPNFNAGNLTNKLTTDHICNNDLVLTKDITKTLLLHTRFYNLNLDQNRFKEANLSGIVTITNVSCTASE